MGFICSMFIVVSLGLYFAYLNVEAQSHGNANTYIDQVIENLRVDIREKQMDPMQMEDMGDCKNCVLEGLSTIYRSGDASLTTVGDRVALDVNLAAGEIKARCECRKKFARFIKVKGKVWARVRDLSIHGRISQSLENDNDRTLEAFTLTNEGSLDVGVSGGGIRRLINEAILALFRGRIKSRIRSAIRDKLPEMVRKAVERSSTKINL